MARNVNLNENKKAQELISAILRVFPKASIVSKPELKSFQQSVSTTKGNPALAKHAKPQQAVLRACKRKVIDSRQLSLFDDNGAPL